MDTRPVSGQSGPVHIEPHHLHDLEAQPHTKNEVKLEVKGLDFFYNKDAQALYNVDLKFRAKQTTALIGPSGCGKSTLLRVLNRIYSLYPGQFAEGEVLLDGKNVLAKSVDMNMLRSRIGMVFQRPTPFPMSIYDNIAFGIRLYEKLTKREMDQRVENALRGANLWEEAKDKLAANGMGLSGGQQQRLCIARTIALNPEVILMDEPTSALDPISTQAVEELILELEKQFTIVIVTHNMQQAARISDYTAFMYLGKLIEFDFTDKIFSEPAEQRTRDYIKGEFG